MSNVYPLKGPGREKIPSEEEERPVYQLRGHVFKHPMKHCRPRHLWPQGHQNFSEDERKAAEIYLANFAEPIRSIAEEVKCPACDSQVTGHHTIVTDWRHKNAITWDPQTMEGHCVTCGYPMRMSHKVLLGDRVIFFLKEFPLFYHPNATQSK